MKHKALLRTSLVLSLIVFILASCDDSLQQLGYSIQPGGDKINVSTGTLALEAKTVNVDSIFIKTRNPVLGEYRDPIYGTIKSDYIGEFFNAESAEFIAGAVVDSVRLAVSYASFIGDSLAPMEVSAYKVIKSLPKGQNYTSLDPLLYCDMSSKLGSQSFTGKNSSYRQEVYYTTSNTLDTLNIYEIVMDMPMSIGTDFLEEFRKPKPNAFENAETFREYFKGVYIKPTFGSGTVINVSLTSLSVHYHYLDPGGSSTETDTIRTAAFVMNMTPEVIQINHISNKNSTLLQPSDDFAYVSSPANVNTEITFPFSQIKDELDANSLNQAKFVVYASPDNSLHSQVKLSPPSNLLLIHRDSVNSFFENKKIPDYKTSFIATFASSSFSYDFKNISAMVNYYKGLDQYKNGTQEFNLPFVLIPVDATFPTSTDLYGRVTVSSVPSVVNNQMMPTAVTIDKSSEKMKLELIYSSFNN